MKLRKLLFAAAVTLSTAWAVEAQQPYGGCWHPDDIKDWSPETDPDAKFNRSRVPLADRFKEPELMKANANQWYEGQVCNATILFNTCSACPSQGANNFLGYQPTYWQYMDKLVYWAGSASEGIIIPPPAPSVYAAHQGGVKVLGLFFFPPGAFG
ncbi:MAG: carbohydrate-binding protein, partial [Muribaculaceae bacterium]|nr:carbohydrate-binding protein [Muribaculaceae bacterium]